MTRRTDLTDVLVAAMGMRNRNEIFILPSWDAVQTRKSRKAIFSFQNNEEVFGDEVSVGQHDDNDDDAMIPQGHSDAQTARPKTPGSILVLAWKTDQELVQHSLQDAPLTFQIVFPQSEKVSAVVLSWLLWARRFIQTMLWKCSTKCAFLSCWVFSRALLLARSDSTSHSAMSSGCLSGCLSVAGPLPHPLPLSCPPPNMISGQLRQF